MSTNYERWQQILVAEFFTAQDVPTALFVDDDTLSALDPQSTNASRDLTQSVSAEININNGGNMFTPITRKLARWKTGHREEAPPILPLIAVTVLAATRMRSDGQTRATNYYLRLAESLLPLADEHEATRLRNTLRQSKGFLDVVEMWRELHNWIESQEGAAGISTIREHPRLQRIGYPLSQALIRHTDRAKLTRFFSDLAFPLGNPPEIETLARALEAWTVTERNRLSDNLSQGLNDVDVRPLLMQVIDTHARTWDGNVTTADGRLRLAMLVGIDLDAWTSTLMFPVPENGPDELKIENYADQAQLTLKSMPGYDYYMASRPTPLTEGSLRNGIRFKAGDYATELPPTPILILGPDPQTGGWTSTSGIIPYEEHLIAVNAANQKDFETVLENSADDGWRKINQRRSILISGYALYTNVRFASGSRLAESLRNYPGLKRMGVQPALTPRARLVRGLPIATRLSSKHYITGGEPDLLLPSALEPYSAMVTLNGTAQALCANGFPIQLRRFSDQDGRNVIEVDGQRLTFTTSPEDPDPNPVTGSFSIGWTTQLQIGRRAQNQQPALVGASVSDRQSAFRALVRRGRDETWILHKNGKTEKLQEPRTPRFLDHISIDIHTPFFEVEVPPSARWLAQRRGKTWRLIDLTSETPQEYESSFDVVAAWGRASTNENASKLWKHLLKIDRNIA